jgi:hypothetical protein
MVGATFLIGGMVLLISAKIAFMLFRQLPAVLLFATAIGLTSYRRSVMETGCAAHLSW